MERKKYEQRLADMTMEATTWRTSWQEIGRYIAPDRGNFNSKINEGSLLDHRTILDEVGCSALKILAAGLVSGLTSPSRPWFKLSLADRELANYISVKRWLDIAQERMADVFGKSNIYGALNNIYKELGAFGTASALILEDYENVIRAYTFTAGEYYLSNDKTGRVNGMARKYQKTIGQLVESFGIEKVSQSVKDLYKSNRFDNWVTCNHMILPDTKSKDNTQKKISIYWEEGSPNDTFLRVASFEDNPIIAPRWETVTSSSIYGKGPGFDALGSIKMLQKMQSDKLLGLAKSINPPMQADASVDVVNVLPGGLTRSSGVTPNAGVRPAYQIPIDLQSIEFSIGEVRQRIEKIFYNDLFMMLISGDQGKMTAREVVERHEEKMGRLGPVIESFRHELLDPLINRTFNIMLRAGLFPEPPKELQGVEIKIEYTSILAQAQRMIGTAATEQGLGFAINLAQANQEVLDNVNFDELLLDYEDKIGFPAKALRSKEEVATIRQTRQQAIQQAQQAQTSMNLVDSAKTLSETKMNEGNALDSLVKQVGGQKVAA